MTRVVGPGGFWRRAAALGVDWLWLSAVTSSIAWLLFGQPWPAWGAPDQLGITLVHEVPPALVCLVGWVAFATTPGKLLLELRVVDARTGGRPSVVQALVRYVGYIVSALPLGLGFAWAAWDRNKEALHDKLARTRVQHVVEEILPEALA